MREGETLPATITVDVWKERLERQGHRVIRPTWETVTGFSVLPDADTWITMAVEPDGTLSPKRRSTQHLLVRVRNRPAPR